MPVKTEVSIRRAERDDLDTVVAWMDEPDFLHFLYGDPARSPKQLRAQIIGMLGRTTHNTVPQGIYLIIEFKGHKPVGLLSLQRISWRNRSCSIDLYMADRDRRNSIIAAVATYQALDYCFNQLNLHRVSAYIYAFNTASWRLMEKTGAKREVTLRDHIRRDGVLYDVYGYGLLREEFRQLRDSQPEFFDGVSLAAMIEGQKADPAAESGR